MSAVATTARFLPCADGYRLLVEYAPNGRARGDILFVHPFAEEMNKSRRAVSNAARALATAGWNVTTLDLLGCGDSSADFGEATWDAWIADIAFVWNLLAQTRQSTPVLWGLRVGALLAVDVIERLPRSPNLVLWQPVVSGRTYLNQFLRLKVAAHMLGQEGAAVNTKGLHAELEAGRRIEVAGYTIDPKLALPMSLSELNPPDRVPARVLWCEVAARAEDLTISPAAAARQGKWRNAGVEVNTVVVSEMAFWQTQEIAECPALAAATVEAMAWVTA